MTDTIIAVIGTLCGSALTGLLEHVIAGATRRAERAEARRQAQLAAVTTLTSALADHRRAMWIRESLRLSRADPEDFASARAESHATRSAITAPLTTVAILAPTLAAAARRAADAAYDLRDAPDADELARLRKTAIAASDDLVSDAGGLLGSPVYAEGEAA